MAERAFGAKQNRSGFVHHILGGQSRKLRLLLVHKQNSAIGPHRAHQRRQIVDHLTEAFASVAQIAFARVLRLAFLLHKTGELRRPLGFAMVGGLAVSQVLTLYTTPIVYLYLERLQRMLLPKRAHPLPTLAEKMGTAAGN